MVIQSGCLLVLLAPCVFFLDTIFFIDLSRAPFQLIRYFFFISLDYLFCLSLERVGFAWAGS